MMWKKIGKALLFPHVAVLILLLPVATVTVPHSLINPDANTIFVYGSYALSAYTLTVWCVRIPNLIRFVKTFRTENKYARIWFGDTRLRVNASLLFSTLWNAGYGIFQLALGVYHRSAWFYSLAGYYICLALMRFFLVRHSVKNHPGEKMREELHKYRTCGGIFLLTNLALAIMIQRRRKKIKWSVYATLTQVSCKPHMTTSTAAICHEDTYSIDTDHFFDSLL